MEVINKHTAQNWPEYLFFISGHGGIHLYNAGSHEVALRVLRMGVTSAVEPEFATFFLYSV